jgi:hypothetical protein
MRFGIFCGLWAAAGCTEWELRRKDPEDVAPPLEGEDTGVPPTADDGIPDEIPLGGVQGRICAPSQQVYVANARVSLEHRWGTSITYTDQQGFFLLDDVPSGEWTLVVSKGSFSSAIPIFIPPNEITELAEEECIHGTLDIAVVTGLYDDIGHLLRDLGLEFTTIDGLGPDGAEFLRDPVEMDRYDIIFLNCGMSYDYMTMHMDEVGSNVGEYVANGGSLYASDWAYWVVEHAWPDMLDFRGDDTLLWAPALGKADTYQLNVLDPDMVASLGGQTTATVAYDLEGWITPTAYGGGAVPMVEGEYDYYQLSTGTIRSASGPLAVKLQVGEGSVIFTTFHNEAQITLDMEYLLREIIWAL